MMRKSNLLFLLFIPFFIQSPAFCMDPKDPLDPIAAHEAAVLNVKQLIREGASPEIIKNAAIQTLVALFACNSDELNPPSSNNPLMGAHLTAAQEAIHLGSSQKARHALDLLPGGMESRYTPALENLTKTNKF